MIDFEGLAARSFDEPLTPDERDVLRVWADALEDAGDPRGPLIAMEHALRTQPGRGRELSQAMNEHVVAAAGPWLGAIAPFIEHKRAMVLDWRSGLLYGAFFDTRYLAAQAQRTPGQLVTMLLEAPVAANLRRLHVRVRREDHVSQVLRAVREVAQAPPLEDLLVLTGVRATRIVAVGRGSEHVAPLASRYATLRLCADGGGFVALAPPVSSSPQGNAWPASLAAAEPRTGEGRCALGRALIHPDSALRTGALNQLAALGARAFMFVESLMVLLEPGIVVPQAPIAACLPALGDHARIALPLLATITGRAAHYDLETRRAAGVAIAALRS